jgi:hypothetical protein
MEGGTLFPVGHNQTERIENPELDISILVVVVDG